MTGRVPALLVTHADLAEALVRAAERVYGPVEELERLSNEGASRESLEQQIRERVARWPAGGIVFIDFWGGSCFTCGVSATRGREVVVLTGVNLPILLDYLHNRDRYPVDELAERLMQKGQDSVRLNRAPAA
jgi:mannose/fructose-specific phosphotransferase system component IIA